MSTDEDTVYWEEFIDIYRENPCLYNKSEDETKKNIAYGLLVEKLWEIDENADIETVKNKIESLKASLKKEVNKINRSTNNGQEHKPTWTYYKSLSFLTPFEDDTEPVESNSEIQINNEAVESNSDTKLNSVPVKSNSDRQLNMGPVESDSDTKPVTQFNTENSSSTEPPKDAPDLVVPLEQNRVRLLPKNNAMVALNDSPNLPAVKKRKLSVVEEDEYDDVSAFAAYLSSRMRLFDPLQKCIARKLISDVIFLAETKQLELTSAITKH